MRVYDLGPVIWDVPDYGPSQGAVLELLRRIRNEVSLGDRFRLSVTDENYSVMRVLEGLDEFRLRLGGRGGPVPITPRGIRAWDKVFRHISTTMYPTGFVGEFRYVMNLQRMRVFLPIALGLGALGYLASHQQANGAEAVFGA